MKPQRQPSGSYVYKNEHILRQGNQRKFTVQANRTASGHTHWRTFSTLTAACVFIDSKGETNA